MAEESEAIVRLRELSDDIVDIDPDMFRQMIDGNPDGMLVANADYKILLVNRAVELIFGYSRAALIGKRVDILLPESIREVHGKHFEDYFANPSVRPMNMAKHLTGRKRDGKLVTIQISLAPLVSPQGTWAMASIRKILDADRG